MSTPASRIDCIVALAIKNSISPYKNSFPAFARQVLAAKFQVSQDTAKSDVKTLTQSFFTDRWASIIRNNPYNITLEEIEKWEQNYKQESCIV